LCPFPRCSWQIRPKRYTTVTLWSGTVGDSLPETESNLIAGRNLQTVMLNDVFA
jgi:hypothetical protein